jgi:hypothetical protein
MTAGRHLHDIPTTLHSLSHWPVLMYVASTKWWQAALYYDQQGVDEYLYVGPDFWSGYQPIHPRAAP